MHGGSACPSTEALRSLQDAQALKEQIRRSVDLVELIERHVALKRAGPTLKGLCPFHQEKTPSFTVYPAKQFFKCYGCGVGGGYFHVCSALGAG